MDSADEYNSRPWLKGSHIHVRDDCGKQAAATILCVDIIKDNVIYKHFAINNSRYDMKDPIPVVRYLTISTYFQSISKYTGTMKITF